jgi:hypothetical protein
MGSTGHTPQGTSRHSGGIVPNTADKAETHPFAKQCASWSRKQRDEGKLQSNSRQPPSALEVWMLEVELLCLVYIDTVWMGIPIGPSLWLLAVLSHVP